MRLGLSFQSLTGFLRNGFEFAGDTLPPFRKVEDLGNFVGVRIFLKTFSGQRTVFLRGTRSRFYWGSVSNSFIHSHAQFRSLFLAAKRGKGEWTDTSAPRLFLRANRWLPGRRHPMALTTCICHSPRFLLTVAGRQRSGLQGNFGKRTERKRRVRRHRRHGRRLLRCGICPD